MRHRQHEHTCGRHPPGSAGWLTGLARAGWPLSRLTRGLALPAACAPMLAVVLAGSPMCGLPLSIASGVTRDDAVDLIDPRIIESFRATAGSLQDSFAASDHMLLVRRKMAVDASLAAPILVQQLMRGDPPRQWLALLDDCYGAATAAGQEDSVPAEMVLALEALKQSSGPLELCWRSRTTDGAASECGMTIAWSGRVAADGFEVRSDWCSPCLGQRGGNFPLPAARTIVSCSVHSMSVRVEGSSAHLTQPWPNEPAQFIHLGDVYDPLDTLRAAWWTREVVLQPGLHIGRRARWIPIGNGNAGVTTDGAAACSAWRLQVALRSCAANRTAGFAITPRDSALTRLTLRPSTDVPLVEDGSVLEIDFVPAARGAAHALPPLPLVPRTIRCLADGREAWRCDIHQFGGPPKVAADRSTAWVAAIDVLQQVQTAWDVSSLPRPPLDDPSAHTDTATMLAQCSARAWYAGMLGDCELLASALQRVRMLLAQETANDRELSGEDVSGGGDVSGLMLNEYGCLAESMTVAGASDSILMLLETMHLTEAAALPHWERRAACLRAAASGRFWQADHIARAALCTDAGERDRALWRRIREQLRPWCLAPMQFTASGGDPAVIALGAWIATRDYEWRAADAAGFPPLGTIDGHQSGGCARELAATFAEWERD